MIGDIKDIDLKTLTTNIASLINSKPCLCNLFFRLRAKLSLKLNHFIPRCPYYTTYFAFRRSGVHPPISTN